MEEETIENKEESEEETSEDKVEEEKPAVSEKKVDKFNREMHKAVCAECKKECEVPFKPTAGKPVYCRECFSKRSPRRF
jgi:CxxC-x17-CxxC domain-containing protein